MFLSRIDLKKWAIRLVALGIAGFIAVQLVPYGWAKANPPVVAEPAWDSPRTRELAVAACFDCHSNETVWPWYSYVAPLSWLAYRDVVQGRDELNFSEWPPRELDEAREAAEKAEDGEMPPWQYTILHPEARLSEQEVRELADGLRRTIPDSK